MHERPVRKPQWASVSWRMLIMPSAVKYMLTHLLLHTYGFHALPKTEGEYCVGKRTVWFSCHHGKEPAASQARPSVPLCPKHNTVYSCQISTGTGANILYLCEDQLCGMSAPSTDSCTYLALDDLRFVNRPSSGHLGRLEILVWEIRQGF